MYCYSFKLLLNLYFIVSINIYFIFTIPFLVIYPSALNFINMIPEIIKMLGVEYGEEFKIRRPDYEVCEKGVYAFFENEGLVKKNKQ